MSNRKLFDGFNDLESPSIDSFDLQNLNKKKISSQSLTPKFVRQESPTTSFERIKFGDKQPDQKETFQFASNPIDSDEFQFQKRRRNYDGVRSFMISNKSTIIFIILTFVLGLILGSISNFRQQPEPVPKLEKDKTRTLSRIVNSTGGEIISLPKQFGFADQLFVKDLPKLNQHLFLNILRTVPKKDAELLLDHVQIYPQTNKEDIWTISTRSRAAILKGVCATWKAISKWTNDKHLSKLVGTKTVSVEFSSIPEFTARSTKQQMKMKKFLKEYKTSNYRLSEQSFNNVRILLKDIVLKPSLTSSPHLRVGKPKLDMYYGKKKISLRTPLNEEFLLCQVQGSQNIDLYNYTQIDLIKRDPIHPANSDNPDSYPLFGLSKPSSISLTAGDCLWIPSMWWYSIQGGDSRNIAISWRIQIPSKLSTLSTTAISK